jgi:peptidoglycan/xylan/chitin deacetylase (PgdA/CDA1 family)
MNMRNLASTLALLTCFANASQAQPLLELRLTIKPGTHHGPRVALTFDACMGRVDERILRALIDNKIKATIFMTARWMKYNAKAIEVLKANPDLFEIEDHGATHVPAVDQPRAVFGLAAAGSPKAVTSEVVGGAVAIKNAFGRAPVWFRGATGLYTASSITEIQSQHMKIAGYSVLGDGGANFSEKKTAATIASAKDGDVIVAHINQPKKPAGLGVVEGILRLKAAGFIFLRLEDGF